MQEQTEEYLHKFGYNDCVVTTVFHQWMGGFPQDEAEAMGLISLSSTVAALSKATKMITKTPHESIGVPTKEANAMGIKASKFVVTLLQDQEMLESPKLLAEIAQIKKEVDCLMDCILKAGEGDLAQGVVKAFAQGLLMSVAPSKYNAGWCCLLATMKEILEYWNSEISASLKTSKNSIGKRLLSVPLMKIVQYHSS